MGHLSTATIRSLILALTITTALASADNAIDSCGTVITKPGNYSLTFDLLFCPGVAITVFSSDVSLNLKAHTISCDLVDGRPDDGIDVVFANNVSLSNGRIEHCDVGVFLFGASESRITNLEVTQAAYDFGLQGGGFGILAVTSSTAIIDNYLSENIVGLRVVGDQNKIVGNVSTENIRSDGDTLFPSFGIGIGVSGNQNRIIGNTSTYNSDTGIVLVNDTRDNVVRSNIANSNGVYGIGMFSREDFVWPLASENLIQSNGALGNGRSDLIEAKFDPNESPVELVQSECVNQWKNNDYVSAIGPDDCFN